MTDGLFDRLGRRLGATHAMRRELPGGGMSRVFVAHETALKRDVVVKVLPPELISEASSVRFAREIELTARLQHPHILPVLAAGADGDLLYYFTPYVPGESLRARLQAGPMDAAEAVRLTAEVLDALAVAHAQGIVHRDVKPGNVLLSGDHAILADFGIARALGVGRDASAAEASTLAGARAYMAPEPERGAAADIFSAAVMAREMLTGEPGRAGEHAAALAEVIERRQRMLGARRARAIAQVLAGALAADPAARPASAAEFRARLLGASATPAVPARLVAISTAAALVLVAGLVAFRGNDSPAAAAGQPMATTPPPRATRPDAPAANTPDASPAREPVAPRARTLADSAREAFDAYRPSTAIALLDTLERRAPGDPMIPLRVAIARLWVADPQGTEPMRAAAERALAHADHLAPGDAALARGVLAIGERRYPDACAAFDEARRLGARAFDVAIGAGDCRSLDDSVVAPNGSMPARFRSSYTEAFQAYVAAIRAVPGGAPGFAFRRLDRVLFLQAGRVRRGQSADGRTWFARPTLAGDSITYVPFDPRERRPADPAADAATLAAVRTTLRPLYVEWTRVAATDISAHDALSALLESEGHTGTGGADGLTALGENARARALATDPIDALRLARDRMRLLLRAAQWRSAGRLADSLVAATPEPDPRSAIYLLGPAAIAGRVRDAARIAATSSARPDRAVRLGDGRVADLPPAVLRDRAGFTVRAAFGLCDDAMRAAPRRIREQVDAYLPPAGRTPQLDQALFERPVGFNLSCFGVAGAASIGAVTTPPMRAAQALARGDSSYARGMLDALDRMRATTAGQPDNLEILAPDLAVRRLLGRRDETISLATRFLDLLPSAPSMIAEQETWGALLVRTMADLADDAAAAGNTADATRWAGAVADLWGDADPELQPLVARMRALATRPAPAQPR
ncbi:MAG TPA: protein kinase [Gemmatimonadaceae bacterium]|nr:protein kinase [Gemmatimonadaceae bacterium]